MPPPISPQTLQRATRDIDDKYLELRRKLGPLGAPTTDITPQATGTGNFEAIVRMQRAGQSFLAFYVFDSGSLKWNGPAELTADGEPITGVTGDPALIQSTFGTQGNFELVVPQGNRLVHYFRDNDTPDFPWRKSGASIPGFDGPGLPAVPTAISLIQSNFGQRLQVIRSFEGGRITWTSHTGADPSFTHHTSIHYKGMHCFAKSFGPGADEPYAVVSVFDPGSRALVATQKFGPHTNVESGTDIPEIKEIWNSPTPSNRLVIHSVIMEHDSGDPERIRAAIQQALREVADVAAKALETPTPEKWIDDITFGVADVLTDILALGDDVIGHDEFEILASELKKFTDPNHVPFTDFKRIRFNYPTDDAKRPPISDDDASYKVYFEVRTLKMPDQ